jgi:hypothetical protein
MWVVPFDEQRDEVSELCADGEGSYERDCAEVEDSADA